MTTIVVSGLSGRDVSVAIQKLIPVDTAAAHHYLSVGAAVSAWIRRMYLI
jgi:hypothetical protein